jgi:hypothetical protein
MFRSSISSFVSLAIKVAEAGRLIVVFIRRAGVINVIVGSI